MVVLTAIDVASLAISRTKAVFEGLAAFRVPVEIVELIGLAQATLLWSFPLPGAAAFALGGWDLDDGPVVLGVGLHPHDAARLVVRQGFVADGACAGDSATLSVLGAALQHALLLRHGDDLHDARLAVAPVTGHGLLCGFQPLGPCRTALGRSAYVFLGLLRDVHQLGGARAGLDGHAWPSRHAIVTPGDSARLDLEVLIAWDMVVSIHPHPRRL